MGEIAYNHNIVIEVVKGGFLLHYPIKNAAGGEYYDQVREIFTSSRKMNQRIKEVLEAVSTTPVEGE